MNNVSKSNSRNTKKAILAGSMALAVLTGAGIWFTQPAKAADATAAVQDKSADQGSREAGGHGPRRGGFGFGSDELQTKLQEWLSLDADALKSELKEKTLAEIAEEQGVSTEDLKSKLEAWLKENIPANRPAKESSDNSSTDSGTDSQTAKTPDFAGMAAKMLEGKGFGMGHDRGGMMGGGMFGDSEELANLLGLTTDELKAAIKEGSSLADIAEKQNVDVNDVIDLLVSSMTEKLEAQLEEGKLTDEQYETRKTELKNRVTQMVNGEHPEKPAKAEDQSE